MHIKRRLVAIEGLVREVNEAAQRIRLCQLRPAHEIRCLATGPLNSRGGCVMRKAKVRPAPRRSSTASCTRGRSERPPLQGMTRSWRTKESKMTGALQAMNQPASMPGSQSISDNASGARPSLIAKRNKERPHSTYSNQGKRNTMVCHEFSRTGTCTAVDAPFTAFVVVFACSTKGLVSRCAEGVRTAGA